VVAEGDTFPAQAIEIRRAQKIGPQMGHKIRSPLINNNEKYVLARGHGRTSSGSVGSLINGDAFHPNDVFASAG
jgi:hypothetical protein